MEGVICSRRAMIYIPGDEVFITGVYEVMHMGHRPPHQAWLFAGEKFPYCQQCGSNVLFKFIRRASEPTCSHINADQDFAGRVADD